MDDKRQIIAAIETELDARKKRVLNRNAFAALFSAVTDPLGALGRIFLGRDAALSAEQQRISQDIIIKLLCRIDDALTDLKAAADEKRIPRTIVDGLIEAHGEQVHEVTGAHIEEPVEFKPGTHIRASGKAVDTVTGLHLGKKKDRTHD